MKFYITVLASAIISGSGIVKAQQQEAVNYNPNARFDSSKKSINAAAVGKIGNANITISYHSPGVRKRVIWGGLVPYGEVWVTGAHSATTIEIDKPFLIGTKAIPAGKYAIFSMPGQSEWIMILNKNWEQHLADDYDAKDDVVRIPVKPVVRDNRLERLQYIIREQTPGKGSIGVGWDNLFVDFEVEIAR